MSENVYGTVFNIQRFSIHDGPGIRTVVFFKGCPLRCKWCANPESQKSCKELAWAKSKCIGCKGCEKAELSCNLHFTQEGLFWDHFQEEESDRITFVCPSTALHVIGKTTTVDEILQKVESDEIFFGQEEGGLTISGGEPLMQPAFTLELLKRAKEEGIHTAIETTGFAKQSIFEEIASYLDFLIMDIKSMNDKAHIENTGVSNQLILDNYKYIRNRFPNLKILIRTPVIPGVNATNTDIQAIHDFVAGDENTGYEILKYHRFGEGKYQLLHREYPMGEVELTQEEFDHLKKWEIPFSQ